MKSALDFLIGAKRCEIHALEQLAVTCDLVKGVSEFVHLLQKERGTSNVFLASRGRRFAEQRLERVAASERGEVAVRTRFAQLDADTGRLAGGMRLFSRIAHVLHALDALPALRAAIAVQKIAPEEATRSFGELIAGLLAVVFEAADTAADPAISRALVALFNLMQGKELAGQERAVAAAGFVVGRFEAERQQRLQHLIDAQERCFQVFAEFADPTLQAIWHNAERAPHQAEVARLRAVCREGGSAGADAGERWFDCATARIDAMRQVEDCATNALLQLCETKLAAAKADLNDHRRFLDALDASSAVPAVAVFFDEAAAQSAEPGAVLGADGLGPRLGRSVLDLVHSQSERLQTMSDELATVRAALDERKLVERAKGLLMSSKGLSEDEAYKLLRQTAMNQNRRLAEVAQSTLAMADLLRAR